MNIRCVQCHTPFPMNRDQVLAALDEVHREGYKYYSAHCPRCGRVNPVATRQLMMWGQGWTPPQDDGKAKPKAEPAKAAPKQEAAKKAPAKKAPAKAESKPKAEAKPKAPAKQAAAKEEPSTRKKLSSFDFNARTLGALEDAGVSTVAAALKKLEEGKDAVLAINGIGPAGYDEIKQVLKKAGYTLPK